MYHQLSSRTENHLLIVLSITYNKMIIMMKMLMMLLLLVSLMKLKPTIVLCECGAQTRTTTRAQHTNSHARVYTVLYAFFTLIVAHGTTKTRDGDEDTYACELKDDLKRLSLFYLLFSLSHTHTHTHTLFFLGFFFVQQLNFVYACDNVGCY